MRINDKVIYNSITGSVTAKVVDKVRRADLGEILVLRSTSRSNRTYPAGWEWTVPAGSASVVLRPSKNDEVASDSIRATLTPPGFSF